MLRLDRFFSKKILIGLGLGQLISLIVTTTGFSSSELSRRGINAPTSQSLLNYMLLATVYGAVMIYRRKPLETKWWYYLLLGFVDVEANFMGWVCAFSITSAHYAYHLALVSIIVVTAYQYTSLTSVMLLDCWAIPCVLLLTFFFLKTRYKFSQLVSAAICIAGLLMVVFSDVHEGDRAGGSNPLKGDMLVLAGSMLYAISNVSEEFLVKSGDRVELMTMLGVFGAIISACQISILEREELRSIRWSADAVLPFVGFALAMFIFYSTVPVLLKITGAAMLNLSLLTSDMWAVLIRIFAYNEKVDWLYYIAFASVVIGLIIYSCLAKEEVETTGQIASEDNVCPKATDEEAGMGGSSHDQYKFIASTSAN